MFTPIISDELDKTLNKRRKEKELIEAILNKMDEICNQDEETINHYKNLGNVMSDFKRVHIMKSFVLVFKVIKSENTVYFVRLTHHDDAYK
jgi:YafQ family addiction module toxin component